MDGREDKDAQNSSTENPSVAPGAIFTPQEELIEVEETTPTVEPPAVIQPIPVNPNATVSTGTGDIKLPGEKKSHKKIWIVFVIVALLGVIAAGVVFAITNGVLKGSSTSQTQNAKKAFDRYATYALFGEARDELDGEYDRRESYTLTLKTEEVSYDAAYWERASQLLSDAVNATAENSDLQHLYPQLEGYKKEFDFLAEYLKIDEPTAEQLLSIYLERSGDGTKRHIDELYAGLLEKTTGYEHTLVEQKIEQLKLRTDILSYSVRSGCLTGDHLDDTCVSDLVPDDATMKQIALESQLRLDLEDAVSEIATNLEANCWSLSQSFNANVNAEGNNNEI